MNDDFLKRSPLHKYNDGFKVDVQENIYGTRFCDCRYWLKGIKEVNEPIAFLEDRVRCFTPHLYFPLRIRYKAPPCGSPGSPHPYTTPTTPTRPSVP